MREEETMSMTESVKQNAPVSAARIPILDGMNRVHAYQLRFWEENTDQNSGVAKNIASREMRLEVEIIARGLPAFVQCPSAVMQGDLLCEEWLKSLPPS
ncbi:MAG: hypothetical protein KGN79_07365, partial [Acidobacteriota bacterium]|nr:hypothetical protein [Acidobacteriota bacterium]